MDEIKLDQTQENAESITPVVSVKEDKQQEVKTEVVEEVKPEPIETVSKAEYELVKQQLEELKKANAKTLFLANDGREDAFDYIYNKYNGNIDLPVISANDGYAFTKEKEEPKKYKSKEAER
jgi:hypothetical protein